MTFKPEMNAKATVVQTSPDYEALACRGSLSDKQFTTAQISVKIVAADEKIVVNPLLTSKDLKKGSEFKVL